MIYSQLYLNKGIRIPTILSVLIVAIVTGLFAKFSLDIARKKSIATAEIVKRVETTNLTATTATVYWLSNSPSTGSIVYGEDANQLDKTAGDDRDFGITKNKFINHHLTLKDLQAGTTYAFKIFDGDRVVAKPNGDAFTFKTRPQSDNVSALGPASGKIIKPNGQPLIDAVVILSLKDSCFLSTYTKSQGDWVIALNNIRNCKTHTLQVPTASDEIKIEFISEDGKLSTVLTNISKINPLPEVITIGKEYNFITGENVLSSQTNPAKSQLPKAFDIIFPMENAIIAASTPLIKGIANPNQSIQISLVGGGRTRSYNVKSDAKGDWRLILGEKLSPARYVLRANSLTRNFTIAKSGESVLAEATPEATMAAATPTATPIVSLTPTLGTPTPPVTGGGINIPFITSVSFLIMGVGLILLAF